MNEPDQPGKGAEAVIRNGGGIWLLAALVFSILGLAGSLYASLGLGLKACPLCFYQRTFIMSLVAVLLVGLLAGAEKGWLGLIALPLATAGLGIALFHVRLELTGKLECPQGILGWGTVPQQSLAVFVVIFGLLVATVLRGGSMIAGTWAGLAGTVVLGDLLALASCTSNPPSQQQPPPSVYAHPPDVCRPPAAVKP